jgi:hypothetical protein
MMNYKNLTLPILLANCLTISPSALASVSVGASAEVTYTINAISDLSHPTVGNTNSLLLSTAFTQASDPASSYVLLSGDAQETQVSASLPQSSLSGNQFNVTDTISAASADNGNAATLHTGVWSLIITNTSSDSFSLTLSLDYILHATANGSFADSLVLLDYWDSANQLAGSDVVAASSAFTPSDIESQANGVPITLIIAANAIDNLQVQVGIQIDLQNTSAVPVPAAWEVFLLGVGILSLRKRSLN